jgi:hypothetical protein
LKGFAVRLPSRRKSVLVAIAISILLVAAYVSTRRVDQRFIGIWDLVTSRRWLGQLSQRTSMMELDAQGTGRRIDIDYFSGKQLTDEIRWWVSEDQFILQYPSDSRWENVKDRAKLVLAKLTGKQWPLDTIVCNDVISVSDDVIELADRRNFRFFLKRSPGESR